ncbi:hypothetical protein V8E53_014014 [Lactarius tabidus]
MLPKGLPLAITLALAFATKGSISDSEARMATVVRALSGNLFSRQFFLRRTRSTPARPNKKREYGYGEGHTTDSTSPMMDAHGSILAASLTLYDHDSDTASISSTLRTSSGHVTPELHPHDSLTLSFLDVGSVPGRQLADVSKALPRPEARPSKERNAGDAIRTSGGTSPKYT